MPRVAALAGGERWVFVMLETFQGAAPPAQAVLRNHPWRRLLPYTKGELRNAKCRTLGTRLTPPPMNISGYPKPAGSTLRSTSMLNRRSFPLLVGGWFSFGEISFPRRPFQFKPLACVFVNVVKIFRAFCTAEMLSATFYLKRLVALPARLSTCHDRHAPCLAEPNATGKVTPNLSR